MAVVIKNTFLEVAEHKFLYFDEPCRRGRRCHSVPRNWKAPEANNEGSSSAMSSDHQIDVSVSPRSDLSFYSLRGSSYECEGVETDHATGPSMEFSCMTPTSSVGTPREAIGCPLGHSCWFEATTDTCSEVDQLSCFRRDCSSNDQAGAFPEPSEVSMVTDIDAIGARLNANICPEPLTSTYVWQQPDEIQEPENEPASLIDVAHAGMSVDVRTKLKTNAPVFEPTRNDARMEAIVSCLHIALVSCGQIRDIQIERSLAGASSMLIFAEVHNGPHASSRSYQVMQLAKQALDAITARLPTAALLSSRVQKEDCGYSLRSSIACPPDHVQGSICWDMFSKGHCPRRGQCRWYHPQDSDIARIKVCIRYPEDVSDVSSEEQLLADSSLARHKISLGELVHDQ